MQIESGSPVILTDAKGLKKHGLSKGMRGFANSVITIPGEDQTIVFFMPDGVRQSFAIDVGRLELDEERLNEC